MLSNLHIISRGRRLLTWTVKVWNWSERVIELSGDPSYRLAIMQTLLQRDHSAALAQELRLKLRHKKTSLSLLFLIICTTTALEYLLHTWGPLCEPISRGDVSQSLYFLPSGGLSAEFHFHADAFLSCLLLIFTGYFPCSGEHKQQMQPYVRTPGFGAPAAILEFSRATIRLLHSWEKWGCSGLEAQASWRWAVSL